MDLRRQAIIGALSTVAVGISVACSAPTPAAAPARPAPPSASASVSSSAPASASPSYAPSSAKAPVSASAAMPLLPPPQTATLAVTYPVVTPHAARESVYPVASSPLPAWAVSHQRPSPVCSGGCVTVGQPNLTSSTLPPYIPSTAR